MNTRPGLIWEPRAFWDVLRLQNASDADGAVPLTDPVEGVFDKEHFRNEGRFPVVLDRMLLCGVGYLFREFAGLNDPPVGFGDFGACSAILQKAQIQLSVPQRQHYSKAPLIINAWQAEAIDDVSMRYSPVSPTGAGLHNVCRWDFRPPVHLAEDSSDEGYGLERGSTCELWLGTYLMPNAGTLGIEGVTPNVFKAYLAFHEEGAGHYGSRQFPWNAHSRWRDVTLQGTSVPAVFPFQPADGLGTAAGQQPAEWPGAAALRPEDFKQQEQAQAGYNVIRGFSVAIDQTPLTTALQNGHAAVQAGLVERLAARLPTRAKSDAGSQEWWWRPGAPLALVSPSMGPALCYKLPRPIVLHPGDVLEPRMVIPGAVQVSESPEAFGTSIFQAGLSFTGYAAVKGV